MDDITAHSIFQDWLDRVVACVVANDYATWRTTMDCPLLVDSAMGPSEMRTEDQLRAKFDRWRLQVAPQRTSDIVRTAHDVRALAPDHIEGAYTMDVRRDGQEVMPRFISAATLRLKDGHWRAAELNSGLAVEDCHLIHTPAPDDATTDAAPLPYEGITR